MSKRWRNMIIALVVVFGGIIIFQVVKGLLIKRFFANYKPPAVTVSSVKAKRMPFKPNIPAVGNFVAVNGVDVNSEAAGTVIALHFNSGQYVLKGAPLIDIDDSVEQANLKFNAAELALKEINYKRQADLFKRGATPGSSVDEAKANLQQSQANVEKITAEISHKHIQAPFSGQVGIRQVNLGQYITPGTTAIVALQSLDPLYIEFYVPEQHFKRLHLNQNVEVSLEEFPNAVFKGKITAINSKVDTNTHNILVQATLPNCPSIATAEPEKSPLLKVTRQEGNKLLSVTCDTELNTKNKVDKFVFLPGMFAALSIELPQEADIIALPSTAISYSLYGNSIFVIEEGEKDDKGKPQLFVKRVFVATGEQQGNYTIITKGIKEGQLVVSSGELKLENGTRVVINNDVQLDTTSEVNDLGQ